MDWMQYLLKVNITVMVCWALYRIAFVRFTFFQWNRYYLTGSVLLSFILPLSRLPQGSRLAAAADLNGISWDYVDHLVMKPLVESPGEPGISPLSLLTAIYLAGILVMLVSGLRHWIRIRQVLVNSRLVKEGPYRVYIHGCKEGSFTLFKRIFLDRYSWENQPEHVVRHEMVHASQLHSADLLFLNFAGVLLWFNPFVFLLLRYARDNHEFLADEPSRAKPDMLAAYLGCLRRETIRRASPAIASYFKSSTIKKRIIMLTKNHTRNRKKWLYLAIIPVVTIVLAGFQASADPKIQAHVEIMETLPGVSADATAGEIPSIFPLPEKFRQKLTLCYGPAVHPVTNEKMFHRGVDIAAPGGTPVYATAGGTVREAEFHKAWGNYLILVHDRGFSTRYTHLEDFEVKAGDRISKGQEVARVGNTGRSTGPHLHYEVWKDGEHLDPVQYY